MARITKADGALRQLAERDPAHAAPHRPNQHSTPSPRATAPQRPIGLPHRHSDQPSTLWQSHPLRHTGKPVPLSTLYQRGGHDSFASYLGLGVVSGPQGLMGELILMGGAAWLIDGSGNAKKIKNPQDVTTPFAMGLDFKPQRILHDTELQKIRGMLHTDLQDYLVQTYFKNRHKPHAVRMYLPFTCAQLSSIKPGTKVGDNLDTQRVTFNTVNMSYLIAGIWMPPSTSQANNVPGWQLSAIASMPMENGNDGGRLERFLINKNSGQNLTVEIQEIDHATIL